MFQKISTYLDTTTNEAEIRQKADDRISAAAKLSYLLNKTFIGKKSLEKQKLQILERFIKASFDVWQQETEKQNIEE